MFQTTTRLIIHAPCTMCARKRMLPLRQSMQVPAKSRSCWRNAERWVCVSLHTCWYCHPFAIRSHSHRSFCAHRIQRTVLAAHDPALSSGSPRSSRAI